MSIEGVLTLLRQAEGGTVSGQAISQALGVSRAAVWKCVDTLRAEGYQIESGTNRGYALTAGPDLLRAGELYPLHARQIIGQEVVCLSTVDSTNNEVKRRAANGGPHGLVVVSNEQRGGRGRLGRQFYSPESRGLYLSVLLRPTAPLESLPQLTAWVGVAVCQALSRACKASAQLKWINDILYRGKKLGGILTEVELEAGSPHPSHVVVGIGLNLGQTSEDFGPELADLATSLAQEGIAVCRNSLARHLMAALDEMYAHFPQKAPQYLAEYRRLCVSTRRKVQVLQGQTSYEAYVTDIDEDFGLVVETEEGVRTLHSGEISLRSPDGSYH